MSSLLVATTPAADLQLLTIEELRAAAGVSGTSQDADLTKKGLRIAAGIAEACKIRPGQTSVPTLKQETLQETFRECDDEDLILSRRHNIEIISVLIDGTTVDASGYEIDPEAGVLSRLCYDRLTIWRGNKISVAYRAGFSSVPDALKRAAEDFLRHLWLEGQRDPSVKASEVEIEDIDRVRTEYWAGTIPGQGGGNVVPDFVLSQLSRYRNWIA
ncbi:hypothetical protein OIU34_02390 [Pararhizobium sp. BT-229]|uniref:hypothetical protein n=1 Tax=Pararhizobium sp. BT-229 TaxID=2986923 RepID=UPI0021F7F300|nr:hypothetical protein [Pararhizobium sp. BT-229]MCV9960736.1 hypothetical protein [Pararhizobium sp. BT-229]